MGSGLLPAASFDVTALVLSSVGLSLMFLLPMMAFLTALKRDGAMVIVWYIFMLVVLGRALAVVVI